ncbi:MAG: hypothetical protein V3T68_03685, partial [Dehalococcoidales bacterium]
SDRFRRVARTKTAALPDFSMEAARALSLLAQVDGKTAGVTGVPASRLFPSITVRIIDYFVGEFN